MNVQNNGKILSCVDCGSLNCKMRSGKYPDFCLTQGVTQKEAEELEKLYMENDENHRAAIAGARVELEYSGIYTRVEEIMEFAKQIGARKIGIATCSGLIEESRLFAKILRLNGFEVYGAICKVGSKDKTSIGLDQTYTKTGPVMCNPILQAKRLNDAGTGLNVVVGLCVGHDSLFYKYAEALTTTLITKDRVLGHNPAVALYQTSSYYKRLLEKPVIEWDE
ncbi:MAG: DUF1847 domain-containing protein [Clostridia bacterium]|nr:DUF1847 domain-containing protein [Clostridia bacterium]